MRKKYIGIVVHCSASSFGNRNFIDRVHKENGWPGIGYHFLIQNGNINNIRHIEALDGMIECGRSLESKKGYHTRGYNRTHIGICSISNGSYTPKQASALFDLVVELQESYNMDIENILGHNEVSAKSCPCFDVEVLRDAITYQDKEMFLEYMSAKDEPKGVQEIKYVPIEPVKQKDNKDK